jgi:AraC family transcriptional regulator
MLIVPTSGRREMSVEQEQRAGTAEATSKTLRCASAFALLQHEASCSVRIEAQSHHLLISSRSGPGDVTYKFDGRAISRHVRARGLFFLPAGHTCDVTLHNPLESIHVQLDPGLFQNPGCDARELGSGLAPILGEDDGILQSLLRVMEELVRGDRGEGTSPIADLVASAMARRLIAINHDLSNLGGRVIPARRLSGGHLRKVRNFVEANVAAEIKLGDLADLCGIGVAHFIRLFKSTMGVSPYQYVLGLRIGRAKALLGDRALTLVEVAQSSGFADQQHLIRTFRRVTGVTPGVYRRG